MLSSPRNTDQSHPTMIRLLCLFLALYLSVTPGLAGDVIGVRSVDAAGAPGRPLALTVWYPAGMGGRREEIGANAVFAGTSARRDAPVADGTYPLVVLSHGGLRSAADSGSWLSARLAKQGFLVVEVNGPRPRRADRALDEIWRRPEDLSRALDLIVSVPAWASHIDRSRIAVVGYALGATAAIALSGGKFETSAFVQTCDGSESGPDCAWFTSQGVSLTSVSKEDLERARRDPRITAAVAVSPEYVDVFAPKSLAVLGNPLLLVTLGNRDTPPNMPEAPRRISRIVIPNASISDGFPRCTTAGEAILTEDGGDPALCRRGPVTRAEVHRMIAAEIGSFLTRTVSNRD